MHHFDVNTDELDAKEAFDIIYGDDSDQAFKSFLREGESVYELMLPSYWKDTIHKALKRDTKDKWLADEFISAEAELDPNSIEKVLIRVIEKGEINRRYFYFIVDAAKFGLFTLMKNTREREKLRIKRRIMLSLYC